MQKKGGVNDARVMAAGVLDWGITGSAPGVGD